MTERQYGKLVQQISPKSPIGKDCLLAFIVGGGICTLGQLFANWYQMLELSKDDAYMAASMSLVVLSALFTGLSLYDNLAKYAGAGTLVPITGFANSVAAPAIEYQKEGLILGIGCKIFTIAGPVILYGIFTSWLLGFIYWLGTIIGVL